MQQQKRGKGLTLPKMEEWLLKMIEIAEMAKLILIKGNISHADYKFFVDFWPETEINVMFRNKLYN